MTRDGSATSRIPLAGAPVRSPALGRARSRDLSRDGHGSRPTIEHPRVIFPFSALEAAWGRGLSALFLPLLLPRLARLCACAHQQLQPPLLVRLKDGFLEFRKGELPYCRIRRARVRDSHRTADCSSQPRATLALSSVPHPGPHKLEYSSIILRSERAGAAGCPPAASAGRGSRLVPRQRRRGRPGQS